jgi:hypothetical protein
MQPMCAGYVQNTATGVQTNAKNTPTCNIVKTVHKHAGNVQNNAKKWQRNTFINHHFKTHAKS